MGSQISMEEHTVGVRQILHTLVLTLHSTFAQDEIGKLPVQCLDMVL